jgi:hypothetical protein
MPRKAGSKNIDKDKLIEALKQGKDIAEAGILAGSKSDNVRKDIRKLIKANPVFKQTIVDILKVKQRNLINSISKDQIHKASLKDKATAFGILTDKLQLLQGEADRRIEIIPRMIYQGSKVKFTNDTKQIEANTPLIEEATILKEALAEDIRTTKKRGAKITADILLEDNIETIET